MSFYQGRESLPRRFRLVLLALLQTGDRLAPRQLSFTSARQTVAASWVVLPTQDNPTIVSLIETAIEGLTSQLVGNRPGRIEPRAVKRRPKILRLLNMVREAARELLRSGIDPYKKQK